MRDANMFGELVLIIAAIEQKTAAAAERKQPTFFRFFCQHD